MALVSEEEDETHLEFSEEEVDVGLLESVFFGDLLLDLRVYH